MTSQKRQAQLFQELEAELPLGRMRVFGINYWPVLRFAVNYCRKHGAPYATGDCDAPPAPRTLKAKASRSLSRHRAEAHARKVRQALRPHLDARFQDMPTCDALFWARPQQYQRNEAEPARHPFLDNLRDIVEQKLDCLTVLYPADEAEYARPVLRVEPSDVRRTVATFALPGEETTFDLLKGTSEMEQAVRAQIVDNVGRVNAVLSEREPSLWISSFDVVQRLSIVLREVEIVEAILRRTKPRVVFMTSYTGAYYVCIAARRQRIPTVDIQHGGMHRYHALASNWSRVPRGGYEALPDWFWCWTSQSLSYLDFGGSRAHRGVVGGNPKLAAEASVAETALEHDNRAGSWMGLAKSLAQEERPIAVVALQYGQDALLPAHVLDVWKRTRDRIRWVFRLHPMGHHRQPELEAVTGITPEEIEAARVAPLSALLTPADVLLTKSSTIVHEAISFDTLPILWSPKGREIFDDLVEAGLARAALDAEELERALTLRPTRPRDLSTFDAAAEIALCRRTAMQLAGGREER